MTLPQSLFTLSVRTVKTQFEITEIPTILDQKYFPSLDGLRAISILIVVYSHTFGGIYGGLGVKIFFVISGFLITTLLMKEKIKTGTVNIKAFYIRRAFRILPVAYLYLFVIICLNFFLKLSIPYYHFLIAFLFLTDFIGGIGYIGHYWSLSVEEQFYFIFPALLKKNTKFYVSFLFVLILATIILNSLNLTPYQFPEKSVAHFTMYLLLPLRNFDGIATGSLLSIFAFKGLSNIETWKKYSLLLHISLIPLIIYLYTINVTKDVYTVNSPFFSLLVAIMIAVLIAANLNPSNNFFFKLLNLKIVKIIGTLSYSIYIWQQIFTRHIPWNHSPTFSSITFNLAAMFAVSLASYYLYERRFLQIKNVFASKKPVTIPLGQIPNNKNA